MKQKDVDLLVRDLGGRLGYGVKCQTTSEYADMDGNEHIVVGELVKIWREGAVFFDKKDRTFFQADFVVNGRIGILPFLRPMSSMTNKECEYCIEKFGIVQTMERNHRTFTTIPTVCADLYVDWLNKKHFDYRGLIEKGLALPRTR